MNEYEHTKKLIAEIEAKKGWNYCKTDGLPDNARSVWAAYKVEGWANPFTSKAMYSATHGWYLHGEAANAQPEMEVFAWKERETTPTAPPYIEGLKAAKHLPENTGLIPILCRINGVLRDRRIGDITLLQLCEYRQSKLFASLTAESSEDEILAAFKINHE